MKFGEWQPIETAPRDGTPIIAIWVNPNQLGAYSQEPLILRYVWFDGKHIYSEPTHWMPLPEPPK